MGTDTYTYTVKDSLGAESNEAIVTVEVGPQPPTANDDSEVTGEEVPVTTDVVANDTDPNGDLNPSTVQVQSSPSDGSATANADGTITYDPDASFVGTDSYTYTVEDSLGAESNEATVTVEVGTTPILSLSPTSATNPVGTDHTVTATLQDADGNPIEDRDVDFEIMSGPNAGMTGSDVIDADGKATFTWSSSTMGTDAVIAETVVSNGDPLVSNEAEKTWTAADECDVPTLDDDDIDEASRTLFNTMQDDEGVDAFTFTTLDNFTVASIDPNSGYDRSGNTWTWAGTGDPPTSVDFKLEAGPDNTSTYFLEVTDACIDPNTVTFDPTYELGPAVTDVRLEGNAPNPFSGQTTVEFALPEEARVTLAVYDLMGRKVATLLEGTRSAGTHAVSWNGRSEDGQALASGVYLMRLRADGQSSTQRVTIVR